MEKRAMNAGASDDEMPWIYDAMLDQRAPRAVAFAKQILDTAGPFLPARPLVAIDVGCGYGHTALELARHCERVVGIEPFPGPAQHAKELARTSGLTNLEIRRQSIHELRELDTFDLAVLDNVFEHIPDQRGALATLSAALRPGGVLFMLLPNKLWPIEVHYHLPFLSYLPVPLANRYLRLTGRGTDYTDASYAPTYFKLRRLLDAHPELSYQFVLPADVSLAAKGGPLHYRLGIAAIRRAPWLWAISKAFLVIAVKNG
jgi:2-polyprenyl-3-methyl-5-hydroxy-6-metoxy-1,4-benzoquinol methylase